MQGEYLRQHCEIYWTENEAHSKYERICVVPVHPSILVRFELWLWHKYQSFYSCFSPKSYTYGVDESLKFRSTCHKLKLIHYFDLNQMVPIFMPQGCDELTWHRVPWLSQVQKADGWQNPVTVKWNIWKNNISYIYIYYIYVICCIWYQVGLMFTTLENSRKELRALGMPRVLHFCESTQFPVRTKWRRTVSHGSTIDWWLVAFMGGVASNGPCSIAILVCKEARQIPVDDVVKGGVAAVFSHWGTTSTGNLMVLAMVLSRASCQLVCEGWLMDARGPNIWSLPVEFQEDMKVGSPGSNCFPSACDLHVHL